MLLRQLVGQMKYAKTVGIRMPATNSELLDAPSRPSRGINCDPVQ